jgi:hypothetical protein
MYNNITGNEYVVNKETDKQLHYFAMNHNVMDIMESKGMSDFDYKLFMVICSEMSLTLSLVFSIDIQSIHWHKE